MEEWRGRGAEKEGGEQREGGTWTGQFQQYYYGGGCFSVFLGPCQVDKFHHLHLCTRTPAHAPDSD